MWADFLNNYQTQLQKHRFVFLVSFIAWVIVGYILSQFIVVLVISIVLDALRIESVNRVILSFTASFLMYVVALAIVVGVPMAIKRWSLREVLRRVGITKRPHFIHVVFAVFGFAVYVVFTQFFSWLGTQFIPGFDPHQAQLLGFTTFVSWNEAVLGFLTFVILAPIAEELFFRGFLFGRVRKALPFFWAAVITSLLFGAAHAQLNVGLDTFALSLVLCFLYEGTGAIWSSIALHMMKNAVAFTFLLSASSLQ